MMLNFEELNFIAIILASVAKFIISGIWFSGFLFGKIWMAEVGLKEEELTDPKKPLIIAFLCNLLFVFTVAVLFSIMALDIRTSLAVAIIMAIGISAAQMAPSFAFEGRSLKLFIIYAAQYVVEFVVVTLILKLM